MDYDTLVDYAESDATLGSGPYKFVEFQDGEYMIMEANESYWQGEPPVDRIIYQEYATDDALVQA
jgi:peptide/nickel transport system substrate-binding protein